jgi:hypothetical protein
MSDAASSAFGDLAVDTTVKPLLSTPGLYTAELSESMELRDPVGRGAHDHGAAGHARAARPAEPGRFLPLGPWPAKLP